MYYVDLLHYRCFILGATVCPGCKPLSPVSFSWQAMVEKLNFWRMPWVLQFFAILLVRLLENNLMLQTGVFHPANQVMFRSASQGCHPAGHTLLWAVWRGDSGRFGARRTHLSRAGLCWTHRPALHPVSASLVLHGESQSHSPTEVRRRYIE